MWDLNNPKVSVNMYICLSMLFSDSSDHLFTNLNERADSNGTYEIVKILKIKACK